MSNDVWRWADPDGQQRRVRLDELRAALAGGLIAPNTPVWKPGWTNWQAAHEVPELTSASMGGANGVVLNIPPPPLAMVAVQQDYEKKSASMAPAAPASRAPQMPEVEPPAPPRYIPVQAKMPSISPSPSSSVNLPTMIGGSSASVPIVKAPPPPAPTAPKSVPPAPTPNIATTIGLPAPNLQDLHASDVVEELSDNAIILESQLGSPVGAPLGAPSDPVQMPYAEAPPENQQPSLFPPIAPSPIAQLVGDIRALKAGQPPQNKPLLIGAGIGALVIVTGMFGLLISLVSGGSSTAKTKGSASPSALASAPPPVVPSNSTTTTTAVVNAPVTTPPTAKSVVLGDCTVSGDPKQIAPRALGAAGLEAAAVNGGVAIAFAASAREGVASLLDASTLSPTTTVRTKPGGTVKRVTPFWNGTKLAALVDVDRGGDRLTTRRAVASSPLVDVGVAEGGLVWAPHGKDSFAKLFPLEGDGSVEALRAVPIPNGIAMTFRQGNTIKIGVARGENTLEAEGELSAINGLGQGAGTLGSPSIASSGDRVVVAWADRATTDGVWGVRWTTVRPKATQHDATALAVPAGGLGGNAMSPAVASLGGGRFLLAWTEGSTGHEVRALAFAADGSPSGQPLTISASGDNAGQPAIAINDDGKGAVAFLAARKGGGFEVHVTPISCSRQ